MNDDNEILDEDDDSFPWEDVEASRNDQQLQRKHPVAAARQQFAARAKPCPKCHAAAGTLIWFYFESPAVTWEQLCGRAGGMMVCDRCHVQVDFFCEVIN